LPLAAYTSKLQFVKAVGSSNHGNDGSDVHRCSPLPLPA